LYNSFVFTSYYISFKENYVIYYFLAYFWGLLVTIIRSSWLALGVCSFITLIYFIKKKNKKFFFGIGVLIICFAIIYVYFDTSDNSTMIAKKEQIELVSGKCVLIQFIIIHYLEQAVILFP
jgi:hypothetical protein